MIRVDHLNRKIKTRPLKYTVETRNAWIHVNVLILIDVSKCWVLGICKNLDCECVPEVWLWFNETFIKMTYFAATLWPFVFSSWMTLTLTPVDVLSCKCFGFFRADFKGTAFIQGSLAGTVCKEKEISDLFCWSKRYSNDKLGNNE